MAKWVTTNSSGLPTGFYDDAINTTIPSGAQEVTEAEYVALFVAPTTATFIAGALGSIVAPALTLPLTGQAVVAHGSGLTITSTAHGSALNGTYALDTTSMSLMADLAALISANSGAFPGGASTWSWPDGAGALHVFPSAAEFLAFYQAMAAYRLALYAVMWGAATSLPTAAATIA